MRVFSREPDVSRTTPEIRAELAAFGYATNGATWLRPTAIVPPRFVRFNATFSF